MCTLAAGLQAPGGQSRPATSGWLLDGGDLVADPVERRERGRRVGFDCVCLKDETQRAPLASVDGKYHVQVQDFERFTVPILDRVLSESSDRETAFGLRRSRGWARSKGWAQVFVFDEIGKMELLSRDFIARVQRLLESKNPKLHVLGTSVSVGWCTGTVAIAGGGFIAQSKRLPGVEVVEISQVDRDAKTEAVAARFLAAGDGNDGNDKARAWGMADCGSPCAEPATAPWGLVADRHRLRHGARDPPANAFDPTSRSPPAAASASAVAMGKAAYGQLGRGTIAGSSSRSLLPCRPGHKLMRGSRLHQGTP
eukprot:Skav203338  [mRNA]  locus=scaffold284:598452:604090:- [translate_table: standard]